MSTYSLYLVYFGFMQLKSCFGFDTFFATDVRRFGDGGIFIGNLRKPIDEVIPKLEKKLSDVAGRDVVVWFMEEKANDITKQVSTIPSFVSIFLNSCFLCEFCIVERGPTLLHDVRHALFSVNCAHHPLMSLTIDSFHALM